VSNDPAQRPQQPSMEELQAFTLNTAAPFRCDRVESGVRVVVSAALPSSAGAQFEQWLTAAVRDVRPALKPFAPLVVAMMGVERDALATAIGDAAIVVWCKRKLWYSGLHPEVTVHTLEHEAAHILWDRTGIPDDRDWEPVMREDSTDRGAPLADCLVLPAIAHEYPPAEWIREDWAYSVEWSRDPTFAARFPARSRRIGEVVRTAPTA
jgi:hypothetical protein